MSESGERPRRRDAILLLPDADAACMNSTPATERFRHLHRGGLLLLANAWDAGSARLVESLGAPAVATTSAGLAWAQGHADGDRLPPERLLAAVAPIARTVRVPLSVDLESGYSDDPGAVAELVLRLAGLGVCGINLEDGAGPPERLCAKIERIKRACAAAGTDVFVNARTDVYLLGLAPAGERVAATLARAAAYREAGADGLFVPGLSAEAEIGMIAAAAGLPLNLMLVPRLPELERLRALGVRRLSAGAALAKRVYGLLAGLGARFLREGRLPDGPAMDYAALNALFER